MKKIFHGLSSGLKWVGHLNLILGVIIILLFVFGQFYSSSSVAYFYENKPVYEPAPIIQNTGTTVVSPDAINKPVYGPTPTKSNSGSVEVSADTLNKAVYGPMPVSQSPIVGNATDTLNKPVFGPTSVKVSTSSTSTNLYQNNTVIQNTQKNTTTNIPTIQISKISNDTNEAERVANSLKVGVASTTKTTSAEDKKNISQAPFYTPVVDNGIQIQKTIAFINSLGTTSEKILERAIGIKSEGIDLVYKDTNKDGISDYDSVYIYNIDPIKTSPIMTYEGRRINAGEKVLLGFDPASTSTIKINYEEPKISSIRETRVYKLNDLALNNDKQVTFKGRALPNSFVTLYIYSTPIIVTVKTDAGGEWKYTLNKELEDGQHVMYTASVNNTGKILAKSTPFTFVKTAEAATLIPSVQLVTVDMKPGVWNSKYTIMIVGFFVISILAVLFIIGVGIRKTPNQVININQDDLRS